MYLRYLYSTFSDMAVQPGVCCAVEQGPLPTLCSRLCAVPQNRDRFPHYAAGYVLCRRIWTASHIMLPVMCLLCRRIGTASHIMLPVLISPQPDQEGNKLMFLSEWREFPSAPCLVGGKKNLMTARASMLLKSRAFLTCFRACFLPGRAKDLSAPRYWMYLNDMFKKAVCNTGMEG